MALPIIIAGAGAAGLLAALRLSSAGFSVTILEADLRPGGRIRTRQGNGFSGLVESGAEFIHGDLPLTFSLLEEAGLEAVPAGGQMMRIKGGKRVNEAHFMENWDELMEKMGALTADIPLATFLQQHFPGDQYAEMRSTVQRFAEGYDLADLETASTLALYQEWNEDEQQQYRVKGGYGRLIQYLTDRCIAQGCDLHLSTPVREVRWEQGRVSVICGGGKAFTGSKLIITAPLGILQQGATPPFEPDSMASALRFEPAIPHYLQAARQLGYGSVIKIIIEFKTAFWEEGIGFIISDEAVPTWWTQSPDKTPLLTGWLTAKAMKDFQTLDEGERIHRCLTSLAAIFSRPVYFLEEQLVAAQVNDWQTMPYVAGGYSFETVYSNNARKLLRQPLADTVYFSGEALYEGNFPATVEAAFCAGEETAQKIIAQS